jgi:hypothetical protein
MQQQKDVGNRAMSDKGENSVGNRPGAAVPAERIVLTERRLRRSPPFETGMKGECDVIETLNQSVFRS